MLALNEKEKAARDEFLKKEGYDPLADLEQPAKGSKSYWYEVHPSNRGFGDTIVVRFNGKKCDITDWESW